MATLYAHPSHPRPRHTEKKMTKEEKKAAAAAKKAEREAKKAARKDAEGVEGAMAELAVSGEAEGENTS